MTHWIRFVHDRKEHFGALEGDEVAVYEGELFEDPRPAGRALPLEEVRMLPPTRPTKMIGLWNNFHAAAAKNGWAVPERPLYFIKPPSCFLASGEAIRRAASGAPLRTSPESRTGYQRFATTCMRRPQAATGTAYARITSALEPITRLNSQTTNRSTTGSKRRPSAFCTKGESFPMSNRRHASTFTWVPPAHGSNE